MSFVHPLLNPSQNVERVRDVDLGRKTDDFEGRLRQVEAQVEAMADSLGRLKARELEDELKIQREEVRIMAHRIQEVAQQRAGETANPALDDFERKLGKWLSEWQLSMRQRLEERDRLWEQKLKGEVAGLRELIEARFDEMNTISDQRAAVRSERSAEAASMLADCASELEGSKSKKK